MLKNIFISSVLCVSSFLGLLSTEGPEIISPAGGQVIQGSFEVIGTVPESDFASAELAYAYDNDDNDDTNWFVIASISQPATISLLARWDTTTISDGDYKLRLTVSHTDGSSADYIIGGLMVRNYTPFQSTATTQITAEITQQGVAATESPFMATPYPENQAALSVNTVEKDIVSGSLIGFVCLVGLGIYTFLSGWLRGR
jgi:hypothetical protein